MASYTMTGTQHSQWGGDGVGGLSDIGINALKGFSFAQEWADNQHKRKVQQMLEPARMQNESASLANSFQQQNLAANQGKDDMLAYLVRSKEQQLLPTSTQTTGGISDVKLPKIGQVQQQVSLPFSPVVPKNLPKKTTNGLY